MRLNFLSVYSTGDPFNTAVKVAEGAARSRGSVDTFAKWVGTPLGVAGVGFGAYSSATNIRNAAPGELGYTIAKETGTWLGGWQGASVGAAVAVGLLATAPVSAPVILGASIVGAIGGGYFGANYGGWAFGEAYKDITIGFKR